MELLLTARVLLVDDDPLVLDAFTELLRAQRFLVHAASSPDEALEIAGREAFELLITDVCMPGMTGPDLVDELRRRGNPVPVLYLTAYAAVADGLHGVLRDPDALALRGKAVVLSDLGRREVHVSLLAQTLPTGAVR